MLSSSGGGMDQTRCLEEVVAYGEDQNRVLGALQGLQSLKTGFYSRTKMVCE